MTKISYSVVIPCYNSGISLKKLTKELVSFFNEINESYQIILINDGSPNSNTWEILKELSVNYKSVVAINLSRNFGQQAATLCGLEQAKGEYIITMDDDGQHQPKDIKHLLEHQNHDMVIARLRSRKDGVSRQISSKIKSYFDYVVLNKPKHIRLSPFRLLKKRVVQDMLKIKTNAPFIPALMFYVSRDIVNVDIEHNNRAEGKSNYNFIKRFKLFTLIVINNSSIILNYTAFFGILCSLLSLGLISYLLLKAFVLDTSYQAGWPSLFSAILFFGGINLFILGLIGEYLVRLYKGVEARPAFLIKEIKNQ